MRKRPMWRKFKFETLARGKHVGVKLLIKVVIILQSCHFSKHVARAGLHALCSHTHYIIAKINMEL
jgi:hypothetical protein